MSPAARLALAGAGGLCHAVAMVGVPLLAWGSTPALVLAVHGASRRLAAVAGALFGLAEVVEIFGASRYGAFAIFLMVGGNVALGVVTAVGVREVALRAPTSLAAIGVAAVVPGAEELFSLGLGRFYLPITLADTQGAYPVVVQAARLVGASGVTGLMALSGALVALAWRDRARRGVLLSLAAAVPLALVGLGAFRLSATAVSTARALDVVSVQGAVPLWAYRSAPFVPAIEAAVEESYLGPTRALVPGEVDLVVWPETALRPRPSHLPVVLDTLREEARRLGAPILVGLLLPGREGRTRNGAVLVAPDGTVREGAKRFLVPLLEDEHEPGEGLLLFEAEGLTIGVLICVESLHPRFARTLREAGADLLVVLANDAGFGTSALGEIHARRAALRAVETGLPVVHAGQLGFTRFYDAYGRLLAASRAPGPEVVRAEVPLLPRTP